jgi:UPF0716 protein FxsA
MNIAPWLLLALLSLPVLEIYVLIRLIGLLGFVLTLALLLGAAGLGMSLLRAQGFSTWARIQQALARGELPAGDMIESGILAVGGLLLLIPGFLTDLLALPCLIPTSRRRLAAYLLNKHIIMPRRTGGQNDQITIEGEFKRED